jgi:sec-independent protein translocase protein TatA
MFRNPITDVIVVLVIVLLVMGPKRLPQLGKGLGHGMREFKEGITGESKADAEDKPSINQAAATPDPGAPRQTETQAAAGSAPADSQRQA